MKAAIQKSWISGVLAVSAASLCCIAPLLAFFGGVGGAATYFNWIGPYRPYLIGITILIFAFAWYQKLVIAPRQSEHCCEPAKSSFWQSKKFLLIVTLFSGVLITFPYYSPLFYKSPEKTSDNFVAQANFKYVLLNIRGMGCADCTKHIDGTLMGLNGVLSSSTSFEKAQTIVYFDPAKTNADSINHKIKEIGYQPAFMKND
ncbi:mercuric transport protein MerTP [Mucilaginibacter sp. McL0603]|uniref:mercuric transport protein MerTP n=1 Tax=Mucilaginibacter sp. McL0603 TaxID=3415670 RepID=UPI003CE8DB41